jgi:hypothetical protein
MPNQGIVSGNVVVSEQVNPCLEQEACSHARSVSPVPYPRLFSSRRHLALLDAEISTAYAVKVHFTTSLLKAYLGLDYTENLNVRKSDLMNLVTRTKADC